MKAQTKSKDAYWFAFLDNYLSDKIGRKLLVESNWEEIRSELFDKVNDLLIQQNGNST